MKTLFDEVTIGKRKLNNRFLVAPMTRVSADLYGIPTTEMEAYYTNFAKGGFGGIITEGIYTDNLHSRSYPNQPGLVNATQIEQWKKIVTSIHRHDSIAIAQLMHAGGISQHLDETRAPSAIRPLGEKMAHYGGKPGRFPMPEMMTKENIEDVKNGFINSALNALEAGFDGIELHNANGYLLDQFLTPYTNTRDDEYGGNWENRLRLVATIIKSIKRRVPESFIIGLRISEGKVNNPDYRWEEGHHAAIAILKILSKLPIDYLHVAAESTGWANECLYNNGMSLTGLAKMILNCPVIANGNLHDKDLADYLLQTKQADLFAIGKAALANPDLVNKLKRNRPLKNFDSRSLYPNPSLFAEEVYLKYRAHNP